MSITSLITPWLSHCDDELTRRALIELITALRDRRARGQLRWSIVAAPGVTITTGLPLQHLGYLLAHNVVRELLQQEGTLMQQLTDVQKVTATIAAVDAAGNPAQLDGAPTWSSSNPDIVSVTPAADGLTAVIAAVGPLGTSQISVSADARLGPDVVTLSGQDDVTVVASEATTLGISFGTPEPK